MDIVLKQQQGSIVYLTLNRPEKRNAMSTELIDALKLRFTELIDDASVRVIILRANGEAFCSGADLAYLRELMQNSYEENIIDSTKLASLFELIYTHPKIVISQVQGAALAGGCGLATVGDFCYATPESKFGYTEVKIGFIPAIVSFFLIRKTGETIAKELLLTGKIIDAATAKSMQLITEVTDASQIETQVFQLAQKLATETSPTSVALTKELIAGIQQLGLPEAMKFAAEKNAKARATPDCKRGIAAFLNKEKLSW